MSCPSHAYPVPPPAVLSIPPVSPASTSISSAPRRSPAPYCLGPPTSLGCLGEGLVGLTQLAGRIPVGARGTDIITRGSLTRILLCLAVPTKVAKAPACRVSPEQQPRPRVLGPRSRPAQRPRKGSEQPRRRWRLSSRRRARKSTKTRVRWADCGIRGTELQVRLWPSHPPLPGPKFPSS